MPVLTCQMRVKFHIVLWKYKRRVRVRVMPAHRVVVMEMTE